MLNKDIFNKLVAIRISPSQPPLLGTEEEHNVCVTKIVRTVINPLTLPMIITTHNAASVLLEEIYEEYFKEIIDIVRKETGVNDIPNHEIAVLGIVTSNIEFDNYDTDRTLVKLSTTFTVTPWR